jgi:hypothetical protein
VKEKVMFERPCPLEEAEHGGSPSRPRTVDGSEEAAPLDSRIEDYLDHVYSPLVGLVPYARRQELRTELRGHLEALVATHQELGSARDAAVVLALRRFGHPRGLSRQWAREWTHGRLPCGVQPAWRAMFIALGSFGLATVLGLMLLWIGAIRPSSLPDGIQEIIWLSVLYLLPALAGLVGGLLAPARHALGTFFALALLMPPLALACGAHPELSQASNLAKWGMELAFIQIFCWTPVGCVAAALGGSLRARRSPRPRRWVLQ